MVTAKDTKTLKYKELVHNAKMLIVLNYKLYTHRETARRANLELVSFMLDEGRIDEQTASKLSEFNRTIYKNEGGNKRNG